MNHLSEAIVLVLYSYINPNYGLVTVSQSMFQPNRNNEGQGSKQFSWKFLVAMWNWQNQVVLGSC